MSPNGADASVEIRTAAPDDRLGVRRVLDAAMLDVREDLRERLAAGDVLVARETRSDEGGVDSPVLGALVLCSRGDRAGRVDAVAVRRARRGQGVGSALVRAAAERHARLVAEFDSDVVPFYESLGFDVRPVSGGDGRLRGVYEVEERTRR